MSQNKWSAKGPLTFGVITVCVLVGGFGLWSTQTNIAGAIIASGQIEVDQNRQIVQHPDGGVVQDILVREGDVVSAGDTLVRLDAEQLQSDLSVNDAQLFEMLARIARFEAERDDNNDISFSSELLAEAEVNPEVKALIDGQTRLLEARLKTEASTKEQLEKRRAQIADQIVGINAQQASLETQLGLIKEELTSQQELLDKGLAQASRVLSLQREEANLAGQVGELTASVAQAEGRITETDIEILRLGTERREEAITRLRDLQFQRLELSERSRALRAQLDRLDIRAPASGVVYGMTVFADRSVIRAAEPVLYLVPQDRPLLVAAQVDPIHIDKIFVGQDVSVRFSALDQRRTPELTGTVTQVSADAFQDDQSQTNYYRTEIVLKDGELDRLPDDISLIPGMPAETFIRTADRTPLAHLVKPLSDYFTKAFRED